MAFSGGRFPPELLKKIKDAVSILDVVGEHVVLRKGGANYSGLCPFHSERSPSFSVSEQKQLYHCYGCKKGGDTVSFLMDILGISFPEAVAELAERGRVAMPADFGREEGGDPETQKRRAAAREKLALAHKLNRFVATYYHQEYERSHEALAYFGRRGVRGDLARDFYVGLAPPSWDALTNHLIRSKAPLEIAVELGLIKPSTKQSAGGPGYFDLFRNRGMFPIIDMRGKVAGFGGRIFPPPPGTPPDDAPKYMNSFESLLFQKSKLVFGLYQAQKHIREKDEVILVEGYFDVAAMHAAGFRNVVATCGTALTPDHLQLFKKFASRVTVLFDGDSAGISATERAMEIGLQHGVVLYGAALPPDLDPDELLFDQGTGTPLPQGVAEMDAILAKSVPLIDARIDEAVAESAQGAEARTQALKRIGKWMAGFQDPVGREVRLQSVQAKLGVSAELLAKATGGVARLAPGAANPSGSRPQPGSGPATVIRPVGGVSVSPRSVGPGAGSGPSVGGGPARPSRPMRLTPADQTLFRALIQRRAKMPGIVASVRSKMPPDTSFAALFEHPGLSELFAAVEKSPEILGRFDASPEWFSDPQVRSILTEALVSEDNEVEENDFQSAQDRALSRVWARFSQQIKAAIAAAEAKKDAGLHAKLMQEYLDVQRKMKEFNNFYDEA
jgi:DNA primase